MRQSLPKTYRGELLTALTDLLGTVTADSIKMPAESSYEPNTEVIRLNNEISRMLDAAETDKAVLRSKMTECLAQKYKELGNGCCAVQRLKAELGSTADIAERLTARSAKYACTPTKRQTSYC